MMPTLYPVASMKSSLADDGPGSATPIMTVFCLKVVRKTVSNQSVHAAPRDETQSDGSLALVLIDNGMPTWTFIPVLPKFR